MLIRWIKHFLYKKIAIRRRDILFIVFFFSLFYVTKDIILSAYLKFSAAPYAIGQVLVNKEYDIQKALLKKENEELRELLSLQQEVKRKIVFGRVMTNIYAGSSFWVIVKDSSLIKKGMIVWAQQSLKQTSLLDKLYKVGKEDIKVGYRLIGFVELVQNGYVKVRPVTHVSSRFSAQTVDGDGLLLKGNMRGMDIVVMNNLKTAGKVLVVYENGLKIGVINGKHVDCLDFAGIKWVCIDV